MTMNVHFQYLALVFVLVACGHKPTKYYQGMVVDENDGPIENVWVFEEHDSKNRTKTDKKGYFRLKRNSELLTHLVFEKEGFKTDTIPAVWSHHGERVDYHFIKEDTTVVRLRTKNPNNTTK